MIPRYRKEPRHTCLVSKSPRRMVYTYLRGSFSQRPVVASAVGFPLYLIELFHVLTVLRLDGCAVKPKMLVKAQFD